MNQSSTRSTGLWNLGKAERYRGGRSEIQRKEVLLDWLAPQEDWNVAGGHWQQLERQIFCSWTVICMQPKEDTWELGDAAAQLALRDCESTAGLPSGLCVSLQWPVIQVTSLVSKTLSELLLTVWLYLPLQVQARKADFTITSKQLKLLQEVFRPRSQLKGTLNKAYKQIDSDACWHPDDSGLDYFWLSQQSAMLIRSDLIYAPPFCAHLLSAVNVRKDTVTI